MENSFGGNVSSCTFISSYIYIDFQFLLLFLLAYLGKGVGPAMTSTPFREPANTDNPMVDSPSDSLVIASHCEQGLPPFRLEMLCKLTPQIRSTTKRKPKLSESVEPKKPRSHRKGQGKREPDDQPGRSTRPKIDDEEASKPATTIVASTPGPAAASTDKVKRLTDERDTDGKKARSGAAADVAAESILPEEPAKVSAASAEPPKATGGPIKPTDPRPAAAPAVSVTVDIVGSVSTPTAADSALAAGQSTPVPSNTGSRRGSCVANIFFFYSRSTHVWMF